MANIFLRKCFVSAILMTTSTALLAATEQIECPPSKFVSVKASFLDTIHVTPKKAFVVYSDAAPLYDEASKRHWSLSTMVGGYDFNDAFAIATENITSVTVQWDKYAKKFDGYYCKYTGSDASRVVYLATIDEGKAVQLEDVYSNLQK